jgi:hypothetical protein
MTRLSNTLPKVLPKILPKQNKMLGDKVALKEQEEEAKTFN